MGFEPGKKRRINQPQSRVIRPAGLNILVWSVGKRQRWTGIMAQTSIPERYLVMLTGNPIASLGIPI